MKKISILVLSFLVSLSLVGCDNNEVVDSYVQQEPQVQDEDVTDEYIQQAKENDLQKAKEIVEEQVSESFDNGTDYRILTDEEANTVMIILHLTEKDVTQALVGGMWDDLVYSMLEASAWQSAYLNQMELDVNVSFAMGDIYKDEIYAYTFNDEILFNVADKLQGDIL